MRLCVLLFISLSGLLAAQSRENMNDTGLDIHFSRYNLTDLHNSNTLLTDVGAAPLAEQQYAWGMALAQIEGRWLRFYDFSFQYGFSSYKQGTTLSTRFQMTDILFGLGYPIGSRSEFLVIPKGGVGLRLSGMDIKTNGLEKISWQESIDASKTAFSLYASAITLYGGLRLEYTLMEKESENAVIRAPLALEIGYFFNAFTITDPVLYSNNPGDVSVKGAPDILPNGWRLTLSIGFRGYIRDKQPLLYQKE